MKLRDGFYLLIFHLTRININNARFLNQLNLQTFHFSLPIKYKTRCANLDVLIILLEIRKPNISYMK